MRFDLNLLHATARLAEGLMYDIRCASGAEADWISRLVHEVSYPVVVQGEERARWEEELFRIRCRYLLWKAELLIDMSPRDRAKLNKAIMTIDRLLPSALGPGVRSRRLPPSSVFELPLAPQWSEYVYSLPTELVPPWSGFPLWCGKDDALWDAAERAFEEAPRNGRPHVDRDASHIAGQLLASYRTGFGRPPSAARKGPTCRFLHAFFKSLEGEWCVEGWVGGGPSKRFCMPALPEKTMPTLIRSALKGKPTPQKVFVDFDRVMQRFFRPTAGGPNSDA